MTTDKIEKLKNKWEETERLSDDHERASQFASELVIAWKAEFEVAQEYRKLSNLHMQRHKTYEASAKSIRGKLVELLKESIPEGAERIIPYLEYIEDGGSFTYDAYLQTVAEQEKKGESVISYEDPNPF